MRILQVCSHFPPTRGGVERHVESAIQYLVARGHDVTVIAQRQPDVLRAMGYATDASALRAVEQPTWSHPDFPDVPILNIQGDDHRFIPELRRLTSTIERRDGPFDVIELHAARHVLAFLDRRRLLLSLHFNDLVCLPGNRSFANCCRYNREVPRCVGTPRFLVWTLESRLCGWRPAAIMAKYEFLKRGLVSRGISAKKIEVVPHWLDVGGLCSAIEAGRRTTPARGKTVGFISRLSPFKGPLLALEAYARIADRLPSVRLLFVGRGQQEPEVRAAVERLGLQDRVEFSGWVEASELPAELARCDAFLLTSPLDNYNWALLEQMCAARPIIATATGGTAEVLEDGVNAMLAPAEPSAIAERLERVLIDDALAARLGAGALETVRRRHGIENLMQYERLVELVAGA